MIEKASLSGHRQPEKKKLPEMVEKQLSEPGSLRGIDVYLHATSGLAL